MTASERTVLRRRIDARTRERIGPEELRALRPDRVLVRSSWMPILRIPRRP